MKSPIPQLGHRIHPERPIRRARLLLGGIGAAVCAALTLGPAASAQAAPLDRTPTKAATEAGITAAGGGYAGWSLESGAFRPPQTPHAPRVQTPGAPAQPEGAPPVRKSAAASSVEGIDVASYQGDVNWSQWWSTGRRFAYVKATEGTSYRNPYFSSQYNGSYKVGMIRGAYHFGRPDGAAGYKQARYFVKYGGGWSKDGKTLPGALDIEYNYAGKRCYGNTDAQNLAWVKSFVKEYKRLTGRHPVIYTNTSFWRECLRNSTAFTTNNPLWIAHWSGSAPTTLPGGYAYYTFWQYSGTGTDKNKFSASMTQLRKLATG